MGRSVMATRTVEQPLAPARAYDKDREVVMIWGEIRVIIITTQHPALKLEIYRRSLTLLRAFCF